MSDERLRAHIKRQFVLRGLDEPTNEQCDAVIRTVRQANAAWFPLTLDNLLLAFSPRRDVAEIMAGVEDWEEADGERFYPEA